MLDWVLGILIGFVFGLATGILPGLHPNNTIPIILGLSSFFNPLVLSIILVTTGVVNSFVNFIPSIFLGAPEDATVLGVLPGHRMLLEGRGTEAVRVAVIGCIGGVLFSIAIIPIFALIIPNLYELLRPQIHWLLIAVVSYMIFREKRKLIALIVFVFSGILGYIVLNFSETALFPMLTGLFGLPLLIVSIFEKFSLPQQETEVKVYSVTKKDIATSIGIGGLAGIIAGLLPGIGSTQSTIITQQIFKRKNDVENFLMSIGSVATSDYIYSLLALYLIGNPRSGIAVAVGKLLEINLENIVIFIVVILISASLATIMTIKLSSGIVKLIRKINYVKLSFLMISFLFVLIWIFSGLFGLLVAAISVAIGLIPNKTGINRSHATGCLVLPTILFFLGF